MVAAGCTATARPAIALRCGAKRDAAWDTASSSPSHYGALNFSGAAQNRTPIVLHPRRSEGTATVTCKLDAHRHCHGCRRCPPASTWRSDYFAARGSVRRCVWVLAIPRRRTTACRTSPGGRPGKHELWWSMRSWDESKENCATRRGARRGHDRERRPQTTGTRASGRRSLLASTDYNVLWYDLVLGRFA